MTRESTKENKPASFKSLINVLKPIRDWLKSTPPIIHVQHDQSSNASSPNSSTNKGSSATPNGLSTKNAIVHHNNLLGNGAVEFNTHLMRQQQQQQQLLQQQQQQHQQQQFHLQQQHQLQVQYQQQLYSQPIYHQHPQQQQPMGLAPPLPPPPLPRPRPIIGQQQQATPILAPSHYYSTTPMSMLNSNTSSTPISSQNNNTNSSSRDDNSLYMINNNVTVHRQTPNFNGLGEAQDDFNASGLTSGGVEEQFKRNAKSRMSLPIMQQSKLRRQAYTQLQKRGPPMAQSLGHIYLQHKGETKQASLPNELTAIDTIRALFVCAFPNMLTMEYMSQPHVKIYIYNPSCNIFYELRDIDDVKHESVLRIHQSDPILAFPPPKPRRMIPANHLIYGIPHQNMYNHHPQN